MQRIATPTLNEAPEKSRPMLEGVKAKLGMVPNMMGAMALSPSLLEAYLGMSQSLAGGKLEPALREQIALAVSEQNDCDYCLAAHSALGRMAGLSDEQIADARRGNAADSRAAAALAFSKRVLATQGGVSDEDFTRVRDAGLSDDEILEVVGHVALNVLTNSFNRLNRSTLDFPVAPKLAG